MQFFSKKAAFLTLVASLFGYSSITQAQTIGEYALLAGFFAAPVLPAEGVIPANECINEGIQLSGEYDLKIMTEVDEENRVLKFRAQILPKGTKGVGVDSGKVYHIVGSSKLNYHARDIENPTFPQNISIVTNLKAISEGGDNLTIKAHVQVHIDADGTVKAEINNYELSCQ